MTILLAFTYYFCTGIIIYPLVKKILNKAAEEACEDDSRVISVSGFKKFVFFLFILFWPILLGIIIKDYLTWKR